MVSGIKRIVSNQSTKLIGLVVVLFAGMIYADADAKDIKIGVIDCYSGPSADYAKEALNGFKLAVSEINSQKVLGRKIKY